MIIFFEIPIALIIILIILIIFGGAAIGVSLFTFIAAHSIAFLIAALVIALIEGLGLSGDDDIDNNAVWFSCLLTLPPALLFPFFVAVPAVINKFSGSDDFESLFWVILEIPWLILFLLLLWVIIGLCHGVAIGVASMSSIPVTIIVGIICCAIQVAIFVAAYNSYIGEISKLFSQ